MGPGAEQLVVRVARLEVMEDTLVTAIREVRDAVTSLERRMDSRFEQVDKRFEQVDKRFEQVDKRFDTIDRRFDAVDRRFEGMERRFEGVDRKLEQVDRRFMWIVGTQIATLLAIVAGLFGVITRIF